LGDGLPKIGLGGAFVVILGLPLSVSRSILSDAFGVNAEHLNRRVFALAGHHLDGPHDVRGLNDGLAVQEGADAYGLESSVLGGCGGDGKGGLVTDPTGTMRGKEFSIPTICDCESPFARSSLKKSPVVCLGFGESGALEEVDVVTYFPLLIADVELFVQTARAPLVKAIGLVVDLRQDESFATALRKVKTGAPWQSAALVQ